MSARRRSQPGTAPLENAGSEAACAAAQTLFSYIVGAQTARQRVRGVHGVFNGDILVKWSTSRTHAQSLAANCWNSELRTQYMGTP